MNRFKPLKELHDDITFLPRGGFLVETASGYIQFGAPPETIKDTMLLPRKIPLIYVLPEELFNWMKGISIAEVEFPIYYNYFFRRKRTRIVCLEEQVSRLKEVLQQAVFGPVDADYSKDFDPVYGPVFDMKHELDFFKVFSFDDIVEFCPFKDDWIKIDDTVIAIDGNRNFDVFQNDQLIAHVPGRIAYKPKYSIGERLPEPFVPPLFGITCLGSSHGFDPYENTSGFILWLNHQGIMIDPPVNSNEWLTDSNVSPKYIDSIILTHCHADHDAGTLQKVLEEEKITIYTTPTIMKSFVKKYAALSDVSEDYLRSLFNYYPVRLNRPIFIHGGKFDFFYSLHSIPAMGFKVQFQEQSITYSSDHNANPELHELLLQNGEISRERYDQLKNFPWDSTVVFHESGVPPLHTPVDYLDSLPADLKRKLVVYHLAKEDLPEGTRLSLAKSGMEKTLEFGMVPPNFEKTYQILGMLRHLDFFQELNVRSVQKFINVIEEEEYRRGDVIMRRGDSGDRFYIIYSGNVSVRPEEVDDVKYLGTYDYFGGAALITGEKRSADIVAETDVTVFTIEKDKFLDLIGGTEYEKALYRLAWNRTEKTWNTLTSSEIIYYLTSAQRIWLESMLRPLELAGEGEILREGDIPDKICFIHKGYVKVMCRGELKAIMTTGDMIGCAPDIFHGKESRYTFVYESSVSLLMIDDARFKHFLRHNPGLIMKIRYDF